MTEKSSKPKITFWRVIVLAFLGLAIYATVTDKPDTEAPRAVAAAPSLADSSAPLAVATPEPPPLPLPADQIAFQGVIEASRQAYDAAANDLAKGGERPKRGQAICQTLESRMVKDWVGKVYRLSTNSEGRGVLSVELDGDIWVSTWSIALADIGSDTMIDPASELFASLSALSEGDTVVFSGSFLKDGQGLDCFDEMSAMMDFSMSQPEFVFRFSDVRPAP
ncbi:MAG: hypothetical protein IOD00_15895 [Rhodobacter sp.]|nr:hypothetical protein [Rhodobacter sp.]MCA3482081.1 hypothetical protein [Rhodobacter sp.]MCA3497957.1 hypothetical protein [Rhodobacter sp.]MCA4927288.1 hypothetical protein [Rhodobacter sp.]